MTVKMVRTNIITIKSVVTASTKPGQIIEESRRRDSPMLACPAQLAHRRRQRRQIGAQIGGGLGAAGGHFFKDF